MMDITITAGPDMSGHSDHFKLAGQGAAQRVISYSELSPPI